MVHQVFNDAFEALLAGWHRHMDLVATTDDILKLAESRRQLDALIRRAHRARNSGEGGPGDGYLTAYCPYLDTTVYIPTSEVQPTPHRTVEFECLCEREVGHRTRTPLHGAPASRPAATGYQRRSTRLGSLRLVTN